MIARATLFALAVFAVGASAQEAAAPGQRGEPKVERIVIEDKGARVEELRVRGEVKRIVVTPKGAQDATRDAAPGHGSTKGAAGQRVWNVLNF
jgi:hypothetical protein